MMDQIFPLPEPVLLKEGSVKKIYKGPQEKSLLFSFTDKYSIFDWGAMPDLIEGKGDALLWFSRFFFEELGEKTAWQDWQPPAGLLASSAGRERLNSLREGGLDHHYQGVHDGRFLQVRETSVLVPPFENGSYHYDEYADAPDDILVPLEVVFRFGLPAGSSFHERSEDIEYLKELGLTELPHEDERMDIPVIEVSTKLESRDRYLSYGEARRISGLSIEEWNDLLVLNKLVACRLRDLFEYCGIELWDGKFEWCMIHDPALGRRTFQLVDSIGPDEIRLVFRGIPLSKELLRQFYRDSEWKREMDLIKGIAKREGNPDWKGLCHQKGLQPEKLTAAQREVALMLYPAIAHKLAQSTGRDCQLAPADLDDLVGKWDALK